MLQTANPAAPWAHQQARGAHPNDPQGRRAATGAHAVPHDPDDAPLLAVVTLALQGLDGCDLASGMFIGDDGARVAEASEPLAAELDLLQHELGDGPGPQASRSGSIVYSVDLRADDRWPSFGPQAHRRGIGAAAAIPLIPQREFPWLTGWLTLYQRRPGPFPLASIKVAETLSLYVSTTVNSALHARSLEAALVTRDLIGQAKGILMARRNVDDEQAFALLQQASQHTNRRLRDVAEAIVGSCGRSTGNGHRG